MMGSAPAALAQSDDDQRARELFMNGRMLYDEGEYEAAITAWEEAFDLTGGDRPILLLNIANAYERLGSTEETIDYLNRYRALAPSNEREALLRRIRVLEEQRDAEQQNPGEGDPDGENGGNTGNGGNNGNGNNNGNNGNNNQRANTRVRTGSGPNPGGIALLASGAAGLVVGGVFGGQALSARAEAEGLCTVTEGGQVYCPSAAADALQRDQQNSLISDIGIIAGASMAGAGIIILAVSASQQRNEARVTVLPTAGPQGGALLLQGRF